VGGRGGTAGGGAAARCEAFALPCSSHPLRPCACDGSYAPGGVRISLMVTCLVDGLFPDVGGATVRLLRRLGHSVDVPAEQTCSEQMHLNTGYGPAAVGVIRHHARSFAGADVVVAPSASCVGSVRHQHAANRIVVDLARNAGAG
jgi:hypothetical protein